MDYNQRFDLKPTELSLKILVCYKDPNAQIQYGSLPNVKLVNVNQLPSLPFPDQTFELILCPDILFSETFNLTGVLELLRVGSEVRFSPLADVNGEPSKYLADVLKSLQDKSLGVEIRQIQPIPGSSVLPNAMLRLWNPVCVL